MEIKIIIVSHKRADTIVTHKAVNNVIVCVPESQLEEYKRYNPQLEYVTHPDEVIGSSPKRQWIFEKFGDCFMIDDDVMYMHRVYLPNKNEREYVMTPEEATSIIYATYDNAKQAGVKLFGFNRSNHPKAYSGAEPIVLTGFITGGAYGLIAEGSKIFFPDYWDFVGDDYFLNGINAYHHRYCWIDARFAFAFKETERGRGGVADYRTEAKRKETYFYLKQKFGSAIKPKKPSSIKKTVNKWEKTLSIPF